MCDITTDPDDNDTYAIQRQTEAIADVSRPDFNWAIGGYAPDECHTERQYAIEPQRGDCARNIKPDYLEDQIEDLPDYRDEARIITRTVTYGPWRYVTPEEIRNV